MKLSELVRENRDKIDEQIRAECPNIGPIDDDERELWVMNNEPLWRWAKSKGVRE